MIEGLRHILEKKVVIPTVNAKDVREHAARVDEEYTAHAYTFVPMGPVDEVSGRLAREITKGKTVKGLLIAPYGYGKTSTLVFLWHRCQAQGLLAVPPFYCSSLLDILQTTFYWIRYRFERQSPGLLSELDTLYQRHYGASVEERARAYAHEHGITIHAALNILHDLQASGEYRHQLTAITLLDFLRELVPLAKQAGFKGVVLFPDEFQAFLGRTENVRQAIQQLREFVWGLNSSRVALGVLFSADDATESRIQAGGGDILDRLRADGFYFNLRTIYDQQFPTALWQRYCETFELSKGASNLIDAHTLKGLGQIAEREDLARGPRTVIDAFKQAIRHFERTGQAYSPMALMDDFLEDRIRFEGAGNKLRQVTRQALEVSSVTSPEREHAVKLMAAFPRGAPPAVQQAYGLTDAINALSKGGGHGELMTHLVDGYTLLGLQRTGEGQRRIVDRIIAEYSRLYEADEIHAEGAARAFEEKIIERLFTTRRGGRTIGWSSLSFDTTLQGSRYAETEGTFSAEYPRRKVAMQIALSPYQLKAERDEHDLQFDFLLQWDDSDDGMGSGRIERVGEHTIRWHLALKQPLQEQMPGNIAKLQDFVNPAFISPLLLLSLVDFIEQWEQKQDESIPERDQPELNLLLARLVDEAVSMLFNPALRTTWEGEQKLNRAGQHLVAEVFTNWLREQFPEYVTFYNHAQYKDVLERYQETIKGLPKKIARGHAPLRQEKHELARRFGVATVSTFENLLVTTYAPLLRKEEWKGNMATVWCQLHPLETEIMTRFEAESETLYIGGEAVPALLANQVAQVARPLGYRDEETLLGIQLLIARRLLSLHAKADKRYLYQPPPELNIETLEAKVAEEQERLAALPANLLPPEQREVLARTVAVLEARLAAEQDEEALDELNYEIDALHEQITQTVAEQGEAIERQLRELRGEVDELQVTLRRIERQLEPALQGQVAFVQHLSELRRRLLQRKQELERVLSQQRKRVSRALERKFSDPLAAVVARQAESQETSERIAALEQRQAQLQALAEGLVRWREVLQQADALFSASGLPEDLREELIGGIVPEIQQHLVRHTFEGLKDWEPFQQKLTSLNQQFRERQAAGNQQFGQVKDEYGSLLRKMDVRQAALRARYEFGADEASYRDLFREVEEKLEGRLVELGEAQDRVRNDLVRVEHLQALSDEQQTSLNSLKQEHTTLQQTLQQLRAALNRHLVRDRAEALPPFAERVQAVAEQIATLRSVVNRLISIDPNRTPEEERVMALLETRQDNDLAQLFLGLREQQNVALDELLSLLQSLFKKGQIEIRVRRRSG